MNKENARKKIIIVKYFKEGSVAVGEFGIIISEILATERKTT